MSARSPQRHEAQESGTYSAPSPGDTEVIGARIAAQIVDICVIFIVVLIAILVAGAVLQSRAAMFLLGVAALLGYGTILEGAYGRTLGKMALQIKVVDRTGDQIGYVEAFVRNIPALFGGWVTWLVGMAAIAISDRNQRLFDLLAGTYVVYG